MRYAASVLILALSSCGGRPLVHPELQPYVASFFGISKAMHIVPRQDFDVEFGHTLSPPAEGKDVVAECRYVGIKGIHLQPMRVVVDRALFESLSIPMRYFVIYHELVHCGLGYFDHDSRSDMLMSAYISDELTLSMSSSTLREKVLLFFSEHRNQLRQR